MQIERFTQLKDNDLNDFVRLLPQLSSTASVPTAALVEQMLTQQGLYLFVIYHNKHIAALLTLVTYPLLSGKKAWIEDVIVDNPLRGKGLGKKLVQYALDFALEQGFESVDLTSRPERKVANLLYQNMGFERRTTNLYRIKLKK